MNIKRSAVVFAAAICFIAALLAGPAALAAGASKCDTGNNGHYSIAAPTGLKVSNVTDTTADLKWSAPQNARNIKGYNVYRDNVLVGSVSGTAFTDTGLTPNDYYTWTVKAFDAYKRLSCASNSVTAPTLIIIRDEQEWTTDTAPATINGGLIVTDTGYLKIDAGVVVKIKPRKSVTVSGGLNAGGTADAPVVFTSSSDKNYGGCGVSSRGYWNTISIASGATFTGDNVKILYGSTLAKVQGTLTLTNSEVAYAKTMGIFVDTTGEFDGINVNLHDCCTVNQCKGIDVKGVVNLTTSDIHDCPGTGVLIEAAGTFNGTSVTIEKCSKGVEIIGSINFVLCGVSSCHYGLYFNTTIASGVILNSFMGNDTYGVYNNRPDDVTIDASMNWWGSADGPSVFDPTTQTWSAAGDRVSSGVTYDNWLTEPAQ